MQFIDDLHRCNEAILGTEIPLRNGVDYRILVPLRVGELALSIQASAFHYCFPPLTSNNLNDYKKMDVAIIKGDTFLTIETDETFEGFDQIGKFVPLKETDGQYAYVDVELIECLYQFLKSKYQQDS